ncbi:MAG: aldolase/citrate lyase family protein [Treponemataceae bacterium]
MIRSNIIKTGLKTGKSYIGTFAKIPDASVVELFAICGFDYFIVDNEHSQMSKESMLGLLRAADISGITPIVRVRENSRAQILQALDAGALGIMVPETSTAAEVKHVVDSALYAPEGCRGYTASSRAAGYGSMDAAEYARKANECVMTIAYCETLEGIENLDAMLAVPGLDVMWMGPMDLSQALGVTGQPKHPKVVAAMDDIIARCKKAGVAAGTIASDAETTKDLLRRGVQLIGLSSDQAMITNAGKRFLKEIRG